MVTKSKSPRKNATGKGGRQKKVKKEGPKKALTTYMLFSMARREQIVKERPELRSNVTEISKIIGAEWRQMSKEDKEPYQIEHDKDKERYLREKEEYDQRVAAAASGKKTNDEDDAENDDDEDEEEATPPPAKRQRRVEKPQYPQPSHEDDDDDEDEDDEEDEEDNDSVAVQTSVKRGRVEQTVADSSASGDHGANTGEEDDDDEDDDDEEEDEEEDDDEEDEEED